MKSDSGVSYVTTSRHLKGHLDSEALNLFGTPNEGGQSRQYGYQIVGWNGKCNLALAVWDVSLASQLKMNQQAARWATVSRWSEKAHKILSPWIYRKQASGNLALNIDFWLVVGPTHVDHHNWRAKCVWITNRRHRKAKSGTFTTFGQFKYEDLEFWSGFDEVGWGS